MASVISPCGSASDAAGPACGCAEPASEPSACRRLDPRVSIAILLLLNLIAFAPTSLLVEGAGALACLSVMAWCGRWRQACRWAVAYAVVVAATLVLAALPGPVAASFSVAFVMMRRIFCVGMFASNMIATTRVGEMATALQRMKVPRGGVVAVSVALRFFPTLGAEFRAVTEACRVRGVAVTPASVIAHPLRTVEYLMVPVMSRLAIVVDELSNAAIVRGIDSDALRTSYYELRIGAADVVVLVAFAAVAVSVAFAKMGVLA